MRTSRQTDLASKIFAPAQFAYACYFIVLLGLCASCQQTKTQKSTDQTSIFETMISDEPVNINITTDIKQLTEKKSDAAYQDAVFSIQKNGTEQAYNIKLKPRGKTRKEMCAFPPLKLKFSKETLAEQQMADHSSLKLVTHCQGDEDLVLKEFMTYKMYNILTDKSFKVQLAKVTYTDEAGVEAPIEKYAFIIENTKEMATRLAGDVMKNNDEKLKTIDADQYRLLTLFQYMVGNTDWNLSKRHNIKLVQPDQNGAPVPVPYDFDYSGLVDAPYAKPHPQLPISDVKDRFFQWRGKCAVGFDDTLEHFKSKKTQILSFCNEFELLEGAEKQKLVQYVNSFFEIIEHQDKLKDNLVVVANSDSCKLS